MRMLNRPQVIAVAALGLVLVACALSVALTLELRFDAVQELSDRQDVLARLETRARARSEARGPGRTAAAPAQAFLDAPTAGLAGAELQAYVARLADQHAVLVSFGTQASAGEDAADAVRIEASLEVGLAALQVLLHQLETGTPYVFVESMTVRPVTATATGGAENAPLRVTLGLRALWRRRTA
ncbi:MAG TPA: type II secretion system protein GspM [Xanthobacteraceae bacterium]